ncbi:MAG: DegV family protein [Clostridiales bacterium]|nr:DegV family protein [Clostridiales bacterium]
MTRIGIVADSTCDLGPEWLAEHDVKMVPLKVMFGDESFLDWIDLSPDEFYRKLQVSPALPKTSQPSPAEFLAAYRSLAEQGCTEIVSIHLTAALSGTFESATMASTDSPVPVRIVDTKRVSQATALCVKAAVKVRDAGGDAGEIENAARVTAETSSFFFIPDTLEYLVKGGRAGKAAGLAASILNIKPILVFNAEGTIETYKKVKGLKKAIAELAARVAEESASTPMTLSILSASAPDLAENVRAALDAAGARYTLDSIGSVGAVIGTYGGPRAVGIAYHPTR